MGRIADFDTRLLTLAVIGGALQGRTEEEVNLVNAPSMAEERGIVIEEKSVSEAQDFNELIRVTVIAGGRAGRGRRDRRSARTVCRISWRCRAGASQSSWSRS